MPTDLKEEKALLVLACSQTQVRHRGPLPALEIYDGPNFRTLRRFLTSGWPPGLVVRILSARHGLITPQTVIASYDERMTRARAATLQPAVREQLLALRPMNAAFINVGPL